MNFNEKTCFLRFLRLVALFINPWGQQFFGISFSFHTSYPSHECFFIFCKPRQTRLQWKLLYCFAFLFYFFNMRQTPSSNTISNAYIIHPILDSVQNSLKSLNLFLGYSFSVSHDPKILATFLHRSNNPHSSNQKYIISCKWTFGISYGDSSLWAIKRTCKGVAHLWLQACRQWNSQTTMGPSTHKLFFRQQMDKMEVLNTLSICIKKNIYIYIWLDPKVRLPLSVVLRQIKDLTYVQANQDCSNVVFIMKWSIVQPPFVYNGWSFSS